MSIKARGKSLEKKVVRGSETVGRDVKKGMVRAGSTIRHGARTVRVDVQRASQRVKTATEHGMTRAGNRLKRARHAKPRST
ncbi:MAG: hypothetical protein L3K00_05055 [Thermoplasmata archaeon]|nr:hypothetical protein [Thermoplasmata archaeon]